MRPLSRLHIGFLVAVPLAWAALLLFHPAPDPADIYGSMRDEAGRLLIVHLGTLAFIGLMGAAVILVVSGLAGPAARVSRAAAGVFILCYGAGEAILGIATGVLIRHANEVADTDRAAVARAINVLWEDFLTDHLAPGIGGVAWVVAVVAAAIAVRQAGAPYAASILLAASSVVAMHAPPIGPVGLLCFTAAVVVLARSGGGARSVPPAEQSAGVRR